MIVRNALTSSVKCAIDIEDINPFYLHLDGLKMPCYVQQGMRALQEKYGITDEILMGEGLGLFLNSFCIDLVKEIAIAHGRPFEVEVRSIFLGYDGRLKICSEHAVNYNGKLAARAKLEHYFVRSSDEQVKIVRRPDELVNKFGIPLKLESS